MAITRISSIRIITDDLPRLAGFYETVTELPATWATPDFAEISTPTFVLAMGSTSTVALFGEGSAQAADNHSVIVEFLVDDVDAEFARLAATGAPVVQPPTDMPWGNRSLLIRDPDGSLVNLFTPVTEQAVAKWGLR
ncbi:VOC family protein [Nakamurella sp. YIM 132087]|uniref:VOC family protein n=1 Tax=Nakamurella alba TaxID=2665158 RepID=A0A7K1FJ60_9ACTN|nr:VOC family protein [Nakamurella alba]MTD14162.1 VOC family protein [Nakamurella alba]